MFTVASNASFTDDPYRKSLEGYTFRLYGGAISQIRTIQIIMKDESIQTPFVISNIHNNHWVRQAYQLNQIDMKWIPTNEMLADGLTKALVGGKHERFIKQLGLIDI